MYRFRLANVDQEVTYDLIGGLLRIHDRGWSTRIPSTIKAQRGRTFAGYPTMIETIPLFASKCDADIRAALTQLEAILVAASKYDDTPVTDDSQWLEWAIRGEVGRRSLLLGGGWDFINREAINPFLDTSQAQINLALMRHPAWESIASTTITDDDLSCAGGVWAVNAIPGTMDARPYISQFIGVNAGGGPIARIWAGFRPEYEGLTSFDPVWECEDGTNEAGVGTTDQVDATASGGDKVEIDLNASAAFAKRFTIEVDDILGANYEHMSGRYLVLARCKIAAGTAAVEIRYGYSGSAANASCPRVYDIDNAAWRIRELGEVQFPPEGKWQGVDGDHLRRACIEVWAEDADGAATDLDMDVFYLIPSERFVYVGGADVEYDTGDTQPAKVEVLENDTAIAQQYILGYPNAGLVPEPNMWYVPMGNSKLVLVGERTASHVLTDVLDLSIEYIARHLSYEAT